MKQRNGLPQLWGLFFVFVGLFIINLFLTTDIGKTPMMWLVLNGCVVILACVMLLKNKLPGKTQILRSFLFGALMFLAYQGLNFNSIRAFFTVLLCSLASFSIFGKYKENAIRLLKGKSAHAIIASIAIGVVVGVVWGMGNLFLSNVQWNIKVTAACFLTALSPGILEEISYRMFLYALCLYFMKGEIRTRGQRVTCWFMMVIPHVLIHTPEMFLTNGLISGMVSMLLLSVLFGLPFAFLQRKRDATSAMVSHWLVDVIRFCVLGVPV